MNCNKLVYNGKARNQVAVNKNWFVVSLQYIFFLQMITKLVVCDEKLIISRMISV